MKKFNEFLNEEVLITEPKEGLPLKLQTRYRLEKGNTFMEFYITNLDVEKDEAYMKIVLPGVAHQGITLSSLLAANPVEVDENEVDENEVDENEVDENGVDENEVDENEVDENEERKI